MAPHPIEVLAKRFPAETVATQFILNKDDLDLAGQDFLCQNVEKLEASTLLWWLSHPGAVEAKVPIQRVVDALVAKTEFSSIFMPLQVLPGLERIPENLRRPVVEAFLPRVDPELQQRVLKVAPGSPAFKRIRDAEQAVATALAHELGLAGDRPDAYLTRRLLEVEVAHHDGKLLLHRVRSLLGNLDVGERLYGIRLLSEAGLLADLDDVTGLFSSPLPMCCEAEGAHNDPALQRVIFEHALVVPLLARPAVRGWYVEQVLRAVARGVPWETLVWELPDALLQEVALESMTTPKPAPWVGWALIARAAAFDSATWETLLGWIEQHPATSDLEGAGEELDAGLGERLREGNGRPWRHSLLGRGDALMWCRAKLLCSVGEQQWTMLAFTPLPQDADEAFEDRFVRLKQRMLPQHHLDYYEPVEPRFAKLPLTRERAIRYLRATLARGLSGGEPSRLDDLIAAAEPVPPDLLPEPAKVNFGRDVVRRYRRLGGVVADEVVRAAMLASTEPGLGMHLAGEAPDLVDDKVRDHVRARLDGANLDEILHWHEDHPTIVTQEHVDWAAQIGEVRWDSKRIAMLLPRNVLAVMKWWYHADQPYRMKEVQAVLEASPDLTPAWFVELVLLRVRERGADEPTSEWLAALLKSRSAWKQHGHRVLRDYLKAGDAAVHGLLVAFYKKEYDRLSAEKTPSVEARRVYQKAVQEIHQVFAELLVEQARAALEAKDLATADAAIRGVVCLRASRIAPALHKLRKAHPDLPEAVAELLDVAYEMARYEKGREADVDDVVEALKQFRGTK